MHYWNPNKFSNLQNSDRQCRSKNASALYSVPVQYTNLAQTTSEIECNYFHLSVISHGSYVPFLSFLCILRILSVFCIDMQHQKAPSILCFLFLLSRGHFHTNMNFEKLKWPKIWWQWNVQTYPVEQDSADERNAHKLGHPYQPREHARSKFCRMPCRQDSPFLFVKWTEHKIWPITIRYSTRMTFEKILLRNVFARAAGVFKDCANSNDDLTRFFRLMRRLRSACDQLAIWARYEYDVLWHYLSERYMFLFFQQCCTLSYAYEAYNSK